MSVISVSVLILVLAVACMADPTLVALRPALVPADPPRNTLEVEYVQPKPYEFGYEFADGHGMNQHRRESADESGAVKGSYGYVDPFGVKRIVEYVADENGYKAQIKTNEPGLAIAGQSAANAVYVVQAPPAAAIAQGLSPLLPKLVV